MEKSEISEQQLSFDEFVAEEDHSQVMALIPYTDYSQMNAHKFEFPQKRFFILSVFAHIILAVYALTVAIEKLQKTEVVEVEYISPSTSSLPPAPVSYSQIESPKIEIPEEKTPEPTVAVPKPKLAATLPAPKAQAKTKSTAKAAAIVPAASKAKASNPMAAASTKISTSQFKAEPLATISDIEVPMLSEVSTDTPKKLSLKEIESDFDKIDDDHTSKLVAAAKEDSKLVDDSLSDLDSKMAALSEEKAIDDEAANDRLLNLKDQKNKLKEAAANAAAADAAARAQATANAKALKGPKGTPSDKAGNGNDDNADNPVAGAVGSQSEGIVRNLEDLRQKPGNPRPSYDVADRMNRMQGTIIINAYVTKEGNLTLFRLIQSTGHRNLDRKSLAALKQWKFYPGQEGWVELPFKWDLKGGVEQKPTLLKRK